jgi:di/tricarboxylate transporter
MAGVICCAATGVLPLSAAAVAGAVLAVGAGCLTVGQARHSVDASVLVVIAAALGLAKAFETTGVAAEMAGVLEALATTLGPVGLLASVYVTGMILTEMVTNTAAAALLFPVAIAVAQGAGLDLRPFVLATSISAAVSLATPLGYQTNMMVYGPGGYHFSDFVKMGLPIQLVCGSVAVAMLCWLYDLGGV